MVLKIAVGSEHAGAEYRQRLVKILLQRGYEIAEVAEDKQQTGYPAIAEEVAKKVVSCETDIGILICGTGIGMCMAAGKVPGIRAALCTDSYMGAMAKRHNNANILVFGSRVIGFEEMIYILETFFSESYEGGRHDARLGDLEALEEKYIKL